MLNLSHLLAGYTMAQWIPRKGTSRYHHDDFAVAFTAIAGMLPDYDDPIGMNHAEGSHTIAGGFLIAAGFALVVYALNSPFLRRANISLFHLCTLAMLAQCLHMAMDVVTYSRRDCSKSDAHIYFWPISSQSFHFDCLFGASDTVYAARVGVEWCLLNPILFLWVGVRWIWYKENPFAMLWIGNWLKRATGESLSDVSIRTKVTLGLTWLFIAVLGVLQWTEILEDIGYYVMKLHASHVKLPR